MTVYLDHAAGGPLHPAATDAVARWSAGLPGNPSGSHSIARRARQAVDEARDVLGALTGFDPGGIVFTSGGTESDNLAVLGTLASRPGAVVVSAVEHPAVTEAALASGREVRFAPVGSDGLISIEGLAAVLDPDVCLVSLQLVNHETGAIQDLRRLAAVVRRRSPGAVLHTDAVQGALWLDLADACEGVDLLTLSGHKIGGPQGSGILAVRRGVEVAPVLHGGGQELERRSGTHNVAAIAGLGAAAAAILAGGRSGASVSALRDELWILVREGVDGVVRTAPDAPLAPGHLHLLVPGADSESMLFLLDQDGICASAGAACASGALEPSPVLLAMGVDKALARCALRLTLGPSTTSEDVHTAAAAIIRAACALQEDGQ